MKVHCAALPDALLESELFGYEKRAFTGALARKPGTHVFVASRAGFADAIETRVLSDSEQLNLRFTFQPLTKPSALAPPPHKTAAPSPPKPIDRRWYYATFGVGAAGFLVGAVAALQALLLKSQLNSVCGPSGNECPSSSDDDITSLQPAAAVSTIATAVGAIGVAAEVTLLVVSPEPGLQKGSRWSLGVAANGVSLHGVLP